MHTYSYSQLQSYLTCNALYRHQYLRKVHPRKRPLYFVVGSAVHKFIELFYSSKDVKLALRAAAKEFESVNTDLLDAKEINDLECQKAMVQGICEAYPNYYKSDFDQYESFLTEQHHKIPIGTTKKIQFQAFLDVIAKDAAGDWWIIETKTAGRVDANYIRKIHHDWQVLSQMWVAKDLLGEWPRGVVYNIIKKTQIRLKAGEQPATYQNRVYKEYATKSIADAKHYFTRHELVLSKRALEDWKKEATFLMEMIETRKSVKSKMWPKNTGACNGNFGTCAYLEPCITGKYNRLMFEKKDK